MGVYKYIRDAWKKPKKTMPEYMKARLVEWRREPVTIRVERPTRLDKARSLGYKAKQGFSVVRQRVGRGGRQREQFTGGRRPKHNRKSKILNMNYQRVAEERVQRKYVNLEVLNSYLVAKDGQHHWYEVIMVDKNHPAIKNDADINWIKNHSKRVFRGLTSAGKKARGLRKKGKGSEKTRKK